MNYCNSVSCLTRNRVGECELCSCASRGWGLWTGFFVPKQGGKVWTGFLCLNRVGGCGLGFCAMSISHRVTCAWMSVCLGLSAIFCKLINEGSFQIRGKLLRRIFRCYNRLVERIVWAVRNFTSGTSVSSRAERPSKTTPNLDGLRRQWTTIMLRKCLLWYVKIVAKLFVKLPKK